MDNTHSAEHVAKNDSARLHRHKRGASRQESVVFCLTDHSLRLEYDANLARFDEGKSDTLPESTGSVDLYVVPLEDKQISKIPWKKSQHLEVPEWNEKEGLSSYKYPVDIRLDRISPHLWWKRLFGRVVSVKVYKGPLAGNNQCTRGAKVG